MSGDYKQGMDSLPSLSPEQKKKAQDQVAKATRLLEQQGIKGTATPGQEQVKSDDCQWVNRGIQDVAVADLPDPEGISDESDFSKVSMQEMEIGLQRLQEIKPLVDNGVGANSDYWANYDQAHKLDYVHGYQRVYEAFYGAQPIKVYKDGSTYDINGGRHRIWLAKRMGISILPMRVFERHPPS